MVNHVEMAEYYSSLAGIFAMIGFAVLVIIGICLYMCDKGKVRGSDKNMCNSTQSQRINSTGAAASYVSTSETQASISPIPGITVSGIKEVPTIQKVYCDEINKLIKKMAISYGQRVKSSIQGQTWEYRDEQFVLKYTDSDYGNDHFSVEVNRTVWDDLPNGVNSWLVNEGGNWNYVYAYKDGSCEVLLNHIPGTWRDVLLNRYK